MTKIRKINVSQVEGGGANNTDINEIRPYGEIAVYVGDNNKLELLMFDGVRTHLKSKVLNKGTVYGGDADSGDGLNRDTIKLIPDAELFSNNESYNNDQYIIIDPTAGDPVGHIHIRAGGTMDNSTADLFLGGEKNNVRVSDVNDNVTITTDAGEGMYNWTFNNSGDLIFPGSSNAKIGEDEPGLVVFSDNGFAVLSSANSGSPHSWVFGSDGLTSVPGSISASNHLSLDANYDSGYSVYIGNDHPTAGMLGGVVLGDARGGFVEVLTTKLIINETSVPVHSTGAEGDQAGQVAFDNTHIYYCTASYNQTGHQVTVATLYNGGTTINSNNLQLTKTSDTLQITVGDIISDSDGGATSVVGTVNHDDNYTYIGTGAGGGIAYNCVFPLTFTSTDYVAGGNIWKRVAWSADTW